MGEKLQQQQQQRKIMIQNLHFENVEEDESHFSVLPCYEKELP